MIFSISWDEEGGDWLTPPSSTGIGLIEKLLLDLNWKDHLIKHFWVLFYCRFRKNVYLLFKRSKTELCWLICELAVGGFVRILDNSNLIKKTNSWWKWEEKLATHETWQYARRLEYRLDFWYNLLHLFVNLILEVKK